MKKKLGEIIVELGFVAPDQVEAALQEAQSTGEMLGDVLVRLGWLSHQQLNMALAAQSGAKLLDPQRTTVDIELLAALPADLVRKHQVLPLEKKGDTVLAAMANPYDVLARDLVQDSTGCTVQPVLAAPDWIEKAINFYYETAANLDKEVKELIRRATQHTPGQGSESLGVRLVHLIITKGLVTGASDIHIDPDDRVLRVHYRVDGSLLQEYLMPKALHSAVVTRIKVLSEISIANPNIPHDGRTIFHGDIQDVPIRVSTLPTQHGEAVVLRLLQRAEAVGDMERLGFPEREQALFSEAIRRSYGLILVTGPTGSGKTTTLYTALLQVKTPTNNVITIEDPIEYVLPTVRQCAVNPKAGFTFASALRSALRQDPDIIMVGEIRDQETAALALRGAITGHLVLSTLHTNDAPSAIHRLLDLGVSPTILASGLRLIVAQRLVRRICEHCRVPMEPTERQRALLDAHPTEAQGTFWRGAGCEACRHTGFKGRIGIFEVMENDPEIEELIVTQAPRSRILEAAVAKGMRPLLVDALQKAAAGWTSLDEVMRVAV
ncbi:type IV pilus assembly protein PilB [Desulfacinum hydrothermale DSM 13146]|uniref:Type IV pilus assembly protein PilB n=1 Tax=Desulfacinum hydrothermale DSM 13146 TaxID=1121390 RepID=A0A1W1X4Y7_9BACT|nr:ATPase, T2SS/T4P/T4SS family [Desulfacinum hydrothermale]SMC19029.1 type IV pilus assembly protein PilB [Desulfacinum hydrothermale DSM 13146]